MRILQIRNACMVLELGGEKLLIDPMLAPKGAVPGLMGQPGFRLIGRGMEKRANPVVELPQDAAAALETVTAVIVTHSHPDHLDVAGAAFIKEKGLPLWTGGQDVDSLRRRGLDARELKDGAMGMRVEAVPTQHGHGVLGYAMGPGIGVFLQAPSPTEPSIYITGDTVMTPEVKDAVTRLKPDVIVAPAGSANVGVGYDILFPVDELMELRRLATGQCVFNHLESLDHCPTTREGLKKRIAEEGLSDRTFVPDDGEMLTFGSDDVQPRGADGPNVIARDLKPGFQKWLSSLLG